MAILKVAQLGHPILRKISEKVLPEKIRTAAFQSFIADLAETMREYDGVGLAAPQVHVGLQLAVMEVLDSDEPVVPLTVIINPIITALTEDTMEIWEGCLSLSGLRGLVKRPSKIRLQGLNELGEKVDVVFEGFPAVAVQHETDHLFGKVFLDRMTDLTKLSFLPEYRRYHLTKEDETEGGDEIQAAD